MIDRRVRLQTLRDMQRVTLADPRNEPPRGSRLRRFVLRRTLAGEDGIALILSVLVMGVLTIATTATITAVTSNEHAFGRDRQTNRALNISEAGLNAGVSAVKALPVTATSLSPASGTVDNGAWSYTATRAQDPDNPNLYYWTVTSTGVSPDTHVTRIVSTKVAETITPSSQTQTVTTPASDAYGYGFFMGDPASDCTAGTQNKNQMSGGAILAVNVYIAGSLCVSGSASILEPTGSHSTRTVYIGRKFSTSGGTIGTSSAKIKQATIVGGCIHGSAVACSLSSSSLVWADAYSSTQVSIPKPTIDTNWYTNAQPGPTTGCNNDPTNGANVSTYPSGWTAAQFKSKVLDNDSTRNTSLNNLDLFTIAGSQSWDCRWYGSDGTLLGRLAWIYPSGGMSSTNPGTLIVQGVVFIDGNFQFSGSDYAVYQGRGTLYVNGTVALSGSTKICATPVSGTPCLGNYDQSQNLLELVAVNGSNKDKAFDLSGGTEFEGIAFMNGLFNASGGSTMNGPVIADTANMSGGASLPMAVDPPPGSPGASSTTTTTTQGPDQASWAGVPGSWQQLK